MLNHSIFISYSIIIFMLFNHHTSNAQEHKIDRDLCLWTELKVDKRLGSNFTLSASQHLRLFEDLRSIDDLISELGVKYTINKHFAIAANGRYIKNYHYHEPTQDDYRYDVNIQYDRKIFSQVKLYYRLQFQKEYYGNAAFNKFLHYYETAFRHRIKLGWQLNDKHRLYTLTELFRINKKSREPYFNKIRWWIGDKLKLGSKEIEFAVGLVHQLNNENPYNFFLTKVRYTFHL